MSGQNRSRTFTFIWRIENFSFCSQKKGEYFSSPSFIAEALCKSSWHLDLYPKGGSDENSILCALKRGTTYSKRKVACEFSFLAANCDHGISKELHEKNVYFEVPRNDLLKTNRSIFLPQDALTIRIRIFNTIAREPVQCQAVSRVRVERRCFTWALKPFSALLPNEDTFFTIPCPSEGSSLLQMSFGLREESSESVRIAIINNDESCKFIKCKLSVIAAHDNIAFPEEDEHFLCGKQDWEFPTSFSAGQLMERKGQYLPYDTLSLRCELAISEGVACGHTEATIYGNQCLETRVPINDTLPVTRGTIIDDLYFSYIVGKNCDVILCAGDALFPTHRAVLCSRSPIFSTILDEHDDGEETILKISSVDSGTLSRLLVFLYTDTADSLDFGAALELYLAAYEYQIGSLIRYCSFALQSFLSVINVDLVLDFADVHRDHELKMAAQSFILEHHNELIASQECLSIVEQKPDLAAETMQAISKNDAVVQGDAVTEIIKNLHGFGSDKLQADLEVGTVEETVKDERQIQAEVPKNAVTNELCAEVSKPLNGEILSCDELKQNSNEKELSINETELEIEAEELTVKQEARKVHAQTEPETKKTRFKTMPEIDKEDLGTEAISETSETVVQTMLETSKIIQ